MSDLHTSFLKAVPFDSVKKTMHGAVRKTPYEPTPVLKKLFERWLKNPSKQLYIHGTPGNGKTTSLLWLYHHMVDLGLDVQYASARVLVDKAKECLVNHRSIPHMLNRFLDAGCLILDDLGAEYRSDFFFSDVIYPIINHRLDQEPCMPTLLASNLDYEALFRWYGEKNPDQAHRFISRIRHQCYELHLKAPTFRRGIGSLNIYTPSQVQKL